MARAAWTGAIDFAGFPIHLTAYNVLRSKSADSFKTLAPDGEPVRQILVNSAGEPVEREACSKGVEHPPGAKSYRALPAQAVEAITEGERSTMLAPLRFSPRDSVPLHLATGHFRLVPNTKIPGSEGPAGILWNGLLASERVLVTEWTPRSGSRPALFVVHADPHGLNANTLPYASDFNDVPEFAFKENAEAAAMFETFAAQHYELGEFVHGEYVDSYAERRADVIAKALEGEPIPVAEAPKTAPGTPDLMAVMAASIAGVKDKKKSPAKAKARATSKA